MSEEKGEEEFEEWFKKEECSHIRDDPLVFKNAYPWIRYGYLAACRKRQEKWDTLRHNLILNAEERALRIMDKLEDK